MQATANQFLEYSRRDLRDLTNKVHDHVTEINSETPGLRMSPVTRTNHSLIASQFQSYWRVEVRPEPVLLPEI